MRAMGANQAETMRYLSGELARLGWKQLLFLILTDSTRLTGEDKGSAVEAVNWWDARSEILAYTIDREAARGITEMPRTMHGGVEGHYVQLSLDQYLRGPQTGMAPIPVGEEAIRRGWRGERGLRAEDMPMEEQLAPQTYAIDATIGTARTRESMENPRDRYLDMQGCYEEDMPRALLVRWPTNMLHLNAEWANDRNRMAHGNTEAPWNAAQTRVREAIHEILTDGTFNNNRDMPLIFLSRDTETLLWDGNFAVILMESEEEVEQEVAHLRETEKEFMGRWTSHVGTPQGRPGRIQVQPLSDYQTKTGLGRRVGSARKRAARSKSRTRNREEADSQPNNQTKKGKTVKYAPNTTAIPADTGAQRGLGPTDRGGRKGATQPAVQAKGTKPANTSTTSVRGRGRGNRGRGEATLKRATLTPLPTEQERTAAHPPPRARGVPRPYQHTYPQRGEERDAEMRDADDLTQPRWTSAWGTGRHSRSILRTERGVPIIVTQNDAYPPDDAPCWMQRGRSADGRAAGGHNTAPRFQQLPDDYEESEIPAPHRAGQGHGEESAGGLTEELKALLKQQKEINEAQREEILRDKEVAKKEMEEFRKSMETLVKHFKKSLPTVDKAKRPVLRLVTPAAPGMRNPAVKRNVSCTPISETPTSMSPEPKKVRTQGASRPKGSNTTTFSFSGLQEQQARDVPLTTFATPQDLTGTIWDATAGESTEESENDDTQAGAARNSMHPGGTEDGMHEQQNYPG